MKVYVRWRAPTLLALLVTTPILSVHAGAVNRTIDDQYGDNVTGLKPIYFPEKDWNYGPECLTCIIRPDIGLLHNGSWHETQTAPTDVSRSMTLTFTGTAIWIYGVVMVDGSPNAFKTELGFNLDNEPRVDSNPSSTGPGNFTYDYVMYSRQGLQNTQHTLVVNPAPAEGHKPALFLFDYAIYTFEEPIAKEPTPIVKEPTPIDKKQTPIAAIIGGIVGGVLVLGGLALALFCIRRRRRSTVLAGGKRSLEDMKDPSFTNKPRVKPLPSVPHSTTPTAATMQDHSFLPYTAPESRPPYDRDFSSGEFFKDNVRPTVSSVSSPLSSVPTMSPTVASLHPSAAKDLLRRAELERQVAAARGYPDNGPSSQIGIETAAERRVRQLEMELEDLRLRTGSTAPPAYMHGRAEQDPPTPVVGSKPVDY